MGSSTLVVVYISLYNLSCLSVRVSVCPFAVASQVWYWLTECKGNSHTSVLWATCARRIVATFTSTTPVCENKSVKILRNDCGLQRMYVHSQKSPLISESPFKTVCCNFSEKCLKQSTYMTETKRLCTWTPTYIQHAHTHACTEV